MFGSFLGGKYFFSEYCRLLFATRIETFDRAVYAFVSGLHVFMCNAANKTKSDFLSHAAKSSPQRL
jgi:hypothetical protein